MYIYGRFSFSELPDGIVDTPESLGEQIEEAIYQEYRNTDAAYKNRLRSRVYNLKDSKNPQLRENVLRGVISPKRMATMSSDVSYCAKFVWLFLSLLSPLLSLSSSLSCLNYVCYGKKKVREKYCLLQEMLNVSYMLMQFLSQEGKCCIFTNIFLITLILKYLLF